MSELFVQESSAPTAIPALAKSNTTLGSISKIAKPGAKPPVFAPNSRIPRSTMTANIETNTSPTSLLEEDLELIEESGLLEIEEEGSQSAPDSEASADSDSSSSSEETEHIVELTQSILIDDVEGNPNAAVKAPLSLAPEALDEEIILADEILSEEEIAAKSDSTRVIAMSDIEEVEDIDEPLPGASLEQERQIATTAVIGKTEAISSLPKPLSGQQSRTDTLDPISTGAPISQRKFTTTDKVEALSGLPVSKLTTHEKAVASGLAQYSEGKPDHMLMTPRAHTAPTNRTWPKIVIPALVFVAGISGGVFLASQSGTSSTSAAAPPVQQIQAAPSVPDVAPLAQIEVAPLVVEEPDTASETAVPETAENAPEPSDNPSAADDSAPAIGNPKTVVTTPVIAKPKPQPTPKKITPKVQPIAKVKAKPTPTPESKPTKQAIVAKAPVKSGDPGILMLGAKPPSSIFIDGKPTGLTTPQRSLKLSPGTHKITLVNKELGIRDTFSVTMKSGKQIKRIRNNTNKIK